MTSGPWWAIPVFSLGVTAATLAFNAWMDLQRRRAERTARVDPDRLAAYWQFEQACRDLLDLPVWPTEPTAEAQPTGPPLATLRHHNQAVARLAHRRVTLAANTAVESGRALARLIDTIRDTTVRRPGGLIDEDVRGRFSTARRRLAESVDHFTIAWRHSIGITDPYAAPSDPTDPEQAAN